MSTFVEPPVLTFALTLAGVYAVLAVSLYIIHR